MPSLRHGIAGAATLSLLADIVLTAEPVDVPTKGGLGVSGPRLPLGERGPGRAKVAKGGERFRDTVG